MKINVGGVVAAASSMTLAFALGALYVVWRPISHANDAVQALGPSLPGYTRAMVSSVAAGEDFARCARTARRDGALLVQCADALLPAVTEAGGAIHAMSALEAFAEASGEPPPREAQEAMLEVIERSEAQLAEQGDAALAVDALNESTAGLPPDLIAGLQRASVLSPWASPFLVPLGQQAVPLSVERTQHEQALRDLRLRLIRLNPVSTISA